MDTHQAAGFDPVLVEVIRYKLESIVEEMQSSLVRGSFSPVVKEAADASCSLFRADATVIAQSRSNPSHLGSLVFSTRALLEWYPVSAMQDGDVYVINDPYLGGTHLPDLTILVPVFADGRVIALAANMAHHIDVGGIMPGSVPTNATDIFQEGLRLPALRLARGGAFDDGLLRVIRQNVRMPDTLEGDINAQISACRIAGRRIVEAAERYGATELEQMFETLIDRSERMTRAALLRLPQGKYHAHDQLDNDGIDLDRRIDIRLAVTVQDGHLTFDFTGTSAQVRGPLNIVPSGVHSAAFYGIRAITDAAIPTNGGCFRPITVKLPEGSLVNPREPAPVNGRTAVMKRIASCVVQALAQVAPERFPAASAATVLVMAFSGATAEGRRFVLTDLVNGGSGASLGQDGVDALATDMTNGSGIPAEIMELSGPLRILRTELAVGSGGAGQWRGGLGIVREYQVLAGPMAFTHRGERHYRAAQGLAGGGPGGLAHSEIRRADGTVEIIPSKIVTTLQTGDRVVVRTPGGGGYGPAEMREPGALEQDRQDGKATETAP